jgi:flagellin-like hook-associated protein FlgL
MLQRMRELAVQSPMRPTAPATRTWTRNSRSCRLEISRVLGGTKFNGIAILAADAGGQTFQVGANTTDQVTITTADMSGTFTPGNDRLLDAAASTTEIGNLDTAIDAFNNERAKYGAAQNRFDASSPACRSAGKASRPPAAASWTPTSPRNRQPEPLADPAAGRQRDGGAGQPAAAAGAAAAARRLIEAAAPQHAAQALQGSADIR